jgi:hypothetical protein
VMFSEFSHPGFSSSVKSVAFSAGVLPPLRLAIEK